MISLREFLLNEGILTTSLDIDYRGLEYDWPDSSIGDNIGVPPWMTDKAVDSPEADQKRHGNLWRAFLKTYDKNLLNIKTKDYGDIYSNWNNLLKQSKNVYKDDDSINKSFAYKDLIDKKRQGLKQDKDLKQYKDSLEGEIDHSDLISNEDDI